jgi:hypothetical protein
MLNIKTSDPYDLKPVELTPSELDSVAGGNPVVVGLAAVLTAAAIQALLNNARKSNAELLLNGTRGK